MKKIGLKGADFHKQSMNRFLRKLHKNGNKLHEFGYEIRNKKSQTKSSYDEFYKQSS